jgi:hypothetical protein
MKAESKEKVDFRIPTGARWCAPRVTDVGGGTILATVELCVPPECAFRLLNQGRGCALVGTPRLLSHDRVNRGPPRLRAMERYGSFCRWQHERRQRRVRRTRRAAQNRDDAEVQKHPPLVTRETTITYRLDPIETGTRVTVRDDEFIGRGGAGLGKRRTLGARPRLAR